MLVSVVIPVYNGAKSIGPLVDRLIDELTGTDLQVVQVNDGSPDNSHEVCSDIFHKHPEKVRYVNLARNFGEHNAVMAGLTHCDGDYAVIMDDDFQNPPEEVMRLVQEAERGGFDVVYSYYQEKRHHWLRNLGSDLNGWMANFMLDKPRDLYLSSFKCLNRFLIDEITKYQGPSPYIDGLILRCTDKIGKALVRHEERQEGRSGYTARKLIRLSLSMFVGFSVMPLRVSFLLGVAVSLAGAIMAVLVVVEKLLQPDLSAGWASLALLILLFSGLQLCILGLMGEYIGRTLLNANRQPQFVVRSVLQRDDKKRDEHGAT